MGREKVREERGRGGMGWNETRERGSREREEEQSRQ
jgi:hypothetical protein